jgi:hypothetical protein
MVTTTELSISLNCSPSNQHIAVRAQIENRHESEALVTNSERPDQCVDLRVNKRQKTRAIRLLTKTSYAITGDYEP